MLDVLVQVFYMPENLDSMTVFLVSMVFWKYFALG